MCRLKEFLVRAAPAAYGAPRKLKCLYSVMPSGKIPLTWQDPTSLVLYEDIPPPAVARWNKVGAKVERPARSEWVQNKPGFGHKGLSEGVLLRIWDRLLLHRGDSYFNVKVSTSSRQLSRYDTCQYFPSLAEGAPPGALTVYFSRPRVYVWYNHM